MSSTCPTCVEERLTQQDEVFSAWLPSCSVKFPTITDLQKCMQQYPTMDYSRLLFYAAFKGRKDIVQVLLQTVDPNVPVIDLYPIMAAARGGHASVVKMLLESGADPNVEDNEELTAMIMAACSGSSETVLLLAKYGADVDATNVQGGTAFLAASALGKTGVIKTLLSLGVDSLVTDNLGQNALHLASFWGHLKAVEVLLSSKEIDIQARDINDDTALNLAVHASREHVTRTLLQNGALITMNKFNRTALDMPRSQVIAKLLRETTP